MDIRNTCTILHFTCLPKYPATLPTFLGSAIRGVMGRQLLESKSSVEGRINIKSGVKEKENAYEELFSRIGDDGKDTLPNPYIICHEFLIPRQPTDPLHFDVKLIGKAASHSETVIEALQKGCAKGLGASRYPFILKDVMKEQIEIFIPDVNKMTSRIISKGIQPVHYQKRV